MAQKPKWEWLPQGLDNLDGPPSDTAIEVEDLRTVVREALQNSIDEIDRSRYDGSPTRVRLGVRQLIGAEKSAFVKAAQLTDLVKHIESPTLMGGLEKGAVEIDLRDDKEPLAVFRYEDSRTRGLHGDQFDVTSNFFGLLKSANQTKKHAGGGSHGKGKTVWSGSSSLKCFLIHSITDTGESRVFGRFRDDPHMLDGDKYMGIGYFSLTMDREGEKPKVYADGNAMGKDALVALNAEKELIEDSGITPPGTVFVVPGFIPKSPKGMSQDINQAIVNIVANEYWPALLMNLVEVEVEISPSQIVKVDIFDPGQNHNPQVVAMASACLETMQGRVHLKRDDDEAAPGIAHRLPLALEIPKTISAIPLPKELGVDRVFAGGRYEVTFVLNKDQLVADRQGIIHTFRENGQIVEQYVAPLGIVGFVALGDAARQIAPDIQEPPHDVRAFGNLMIRLMEVPAHDAWSTRGCHSHFKQYFPRDTSRAEAGNFFARFREEAVKKSRQFAGEYDTDANELLSELTRYAGFGSNPPPPPPPKISWGVERDYDAQMNATLIFKIENRSADKRSVELAVEAQTGDRSSMPLPWSSDNASASWIEEGSKKGGRPKNSPTIRFHSDSTLRIEIPAKRGVRVQAKISNDLNSIPTSLSFTRLMPIVKDLGK